MYPGEFYFKLTSNGNLVGEFTNRGTVHIGVESAAREVPLPEGQPFGFAGTYRSSWVEPNDRTAEIAVLTIEPARDREDQPLPRRYRLEWTEGRRVRFHGYGFVAEGLLVGHYGDGPEER